MQMRVTISFYSYLKEFTGCAQVTETLPEGSTIDQLFKRMADRFPNLREMQRSILIAVGVDYLDRDFVLKEGDAVSLFPPVQGG